jgi:GH43 family beta-xylosidase
MASAWSREIRTTSLLTRNPPQGGKSPWGTYTYAGQLISDWSIDGTVAVINKRRYFYWSCQRGGMQSICGAEMSSPTKLVGGTKTISQPTRPWERHGKFPVNEGPELLQHEGRTFLSFSASYCWTADYALGILALRNGGNPLDAGAWSKSGPAMTSAHGNFGPGHNG